MKIVYIIIMTLCVNTLIAQNKLPLKKNQEFQLSGGKSFHGSGDLRGLIFSSEYIKYFKPHLNWSVTLSGTLHDGKIPLLFTDNIGNEIDGSIRYTVGGVQISGHLGYSIIKKNEHEFLLKLGPTIRYQSSSLPNDVAILYPAGTGFPVPVVVFNNTEPQRTFSVGGNVQANYKYFITDRIYIGGIIGFQTDTHGDNISQLSIVGGVRF